MSTGLNVLPPEIEKWLQRFGVGGSPQVVDLGEFMKEDNLKAFESRYAKLALRRDDILNYPDQHCSDEIIEIRRKVKEADEKVSRLGTPATPEEVDKALAAVAVLEKEINDGAPTFRAHDKEVRKYFAELKKLRPQIQLATGLPQQVSGIDTPWKAERVKFDTQKQLVIDRQNEKKFKEANVELAKLAKDIEALVQKKMVAVNKQVDAATGAKGSAKKCKQLVAQLDSTPGLIAAMSSDMQLKLLKTLRTKLINCKTCGQGMTADEFDANGCECTSNMSPACDPYQIEIPLMCGKCKTASTGGNCQGPCTNKVKESWYDCACGEGFCENGGICPVCGTADDVKFDDYYCGKGHWMGTNSNCPGKCGSAKKDFDHNVSADHNRDMLDARAKIMAKMKMDEKFVELNKRKLQEIAKELREFKDFQEAEEKWAEWVRDSDFTKMQVVLEKIVEKQCKILGHDTCPNHTGKTVTLVFADPTTDPSLSATTYGYCKAGFPTAIHLNKAHAGFNDFKEVVDTIIHENSHAWQEMIILKLQGKTPYTGTDKAEIENDPELITQAEMFLENDQTYINSRVNSEAYRHEPLEEHAWNAGGKTSAMLLVPPQVQSMKSSELMKSRTFFLKSIKRQAAAEIVTKERHGIYGSEWEGERPRDKRLQLEYLDRSTGTATLKKVPIQISEVANEYTLETKFNATVMATPLADPAVIQRELKAIALRKFTKELASLTETELNEAHADLVSEKKYQKVGTGKDAEFREPLNFEYADLTGCRLILDETVSKLS